MEKKLRKFSEVEDLYRENFLKMFSFFHFHSALPQLPTPFILKFLPKFFSWKFFQKRNFIKNFVQKFLIYFFLIFFKFFPLKISFFCNFI